MRRLFIEIAVAVLSLAISVCALLALFVYGFEWSPKTVVSAVLNHYQQVTAKFAAVLSPILEVITRAVGRLLGLQITIADHWRHIFLLMELYFFKECTIAFHAGQRGTAVYLLPFGLLAALCAATAVAILPLDSKGDLTAFAIASIPLAGIFAYELVASLWKSTNWFRKEDGTWTSRFQKRAYEAARRFIAITLIAALVIVGARLAGITESLRSPGLAALMVGIAALSIEWIRVGLVEARRRALSEGGSAFKTFWGINTAKVGLSMIAVIGAALATVKIG